MSYKNERKALTREKRISTVSSFHGNLGGLMEDVQGSEIKQRIRTFSQVTPDEILYAVRILSTIRQSTVVVHGAVGCSASGIYYNAEDSYNWYSTNLNERDTILGGDDKLRRAITRANNETNPKVIFVVSTPVVAINNDDINSIILELEDELGVKIISIYTDGFKSKTPVNGYDIVTHSLLKYIVDSTDQTEHGDENFINVITYSENLENLASIARILKDLGIKYNILPQLSSVNQIKKAKEAKASIVLNPEEGSLLARELEEEYKVPYLVTDTPVGLNKTRSFILKLGKFFHVEEKARQYIEEQEHLAEEKIKDQPLVGKNVFLETNFAAAIGFTELIEKLGGIVAGLAAPFVDLENKDYLEKLNQLKAATPVVIASGQLFEKANIVSKQEIDYYIGSETNIDFAASWGVFPVSVAQSAFYGYEGITQLVDHLKNAGVFLTENKEKLYKASWLRKSGNWYVKQEVK